MAGNYETVDRIRRSHRHAKPNPSENPAWANCHMDCGILLAEIDQMAVRIASLMGQVEGYKRALDEAGQRAVSGKAREHQESAECWCHPTLGYTNPETGAQHWIHHEPS